MRGRAGAQFCRLLSCVPLPGPLLPSCGPSNWNDPTIPYSLEGLAVKGSLPDFGHLWRPREERKWVSVTFTGHPHWLLTSVPDPPALDSSFPQSLRGACSGSGGSQWTATRLTLLLISLHPDIAEEENRQKKMYNSHGLKMQHSWFHPVFALSKRGKKMKSFAFFAAGWWEHLWSVGVRAWKGEQKGKFGRADVVLLEREDRTKTDF